VFLETLVALLADRAARGPAREALVALGDAALDRLEHVLVDAQTPPAVRLHVPRTISAFASARAAAILERRLPDEDDYHVRYKILRGLGRLRADDPSMPIDAEALRGASETFLARAATLLAYRVAWDTLAEAGAVPAARGLLPALLADKERRALESVFRVLHILDPDAEYGLVHRGLGAGDPRARAGGREILENVVRGPLGPALLAMTDTQPPAVRLARLLETYALPNARALLAADGDERVRLAHALLARTTDDPNGILRDIARHELAAVERAPAHWEAADAG
jgi:hypothetical protein